MEYGHWEILCETMNEWKSFVYEIIDENNKRYIGAKTKINGWETYTSSSKSLKKAIAGGLNCRYTILKFFGISKPSLFEQSFAVASNIINEAKLNKKNVAFVSSNNSNEIKKLMIVKPDGFVQEIEYTISSLAQHDLLLIHSEEINVLSGKLSTALAMTTAVVQQQTEQAKTLTKHTGIIPANIPPIKLSVSETSLYRKFTQDQLAILLNADMISQEHYNLLQITD